MGVVPRFEVSAPLCVLRIPSASVLERVFTDETPRSLRPGRKKAETRTLHPEEAVFAIERERAPDGPAPFRNRPVVIRDYFVRATISTDCGRCRVLSISFASRFSVFEAKSPRPSAARLVQT